MSICYGYLFWVSKDPACRLKNTLQFNLEQRLGKTQTKWSNMLVFPADQFISCCCWPYKLLDYAPSKKKLDYSPAQIEHSDMQSECEPHRIWGVRCLHINFFDHGQSSYLATRRLASCACAKKVWIWAGQLSRKITKMKGIIAIRRGELCLHFIEDSCVGKIRWKKIHVGWKKTATYI